MSVDIIQQMEQDERAMERMASAFEVIADTVVAWYKLEQQRFENDYPPKHEPRDAVITRIPTDEDKIKESQGSTEETTDEWLDIGPRERALLDSPQSGERKRAPRRVSKASGPGAP